MFKRNSEEFTLPVLLDRLETVIEVLKERETAVTPELVKAVQIAITWINFSGIYNGDNQNGRNTFNANSIALFR